MNHDIPTSDEIAKALANRMRAETLKAVGASVAAPPRPKPPVIDLPKQPSPQVNHFAAPSAPKREMGALFGDPVAPHPLAGASGARQFHVAAPNFTRQQEAAAQMIVDNPFSKVRALAGTGKTTLLRGTAPRLKGRGIYLAYNTAIAAEARQSFPQTVDCRTAHSIAYEAIGKRYQRQGKIIGNPPVSTIAAELRLKGRDAKQIAWRVRETVGCFCNSASPAITTDHIPEQVSNAILRQISRDGVSHNQAIAKLPSLLTEMVVMSTALWNCMTDPLNTGMPLTHDAYLKLWALSSPRLNGSFVLFDEAQDANPVLLGVISAQPMRVVMVGDQNQAIYGFRGAINALNHRASAPSAPLTESFRFGPQIADAANAVLDLSPLSDKLIGAGKTAGEVFYDTYDIEAFAGNNRFAYITRTNAEALATAIDALGSRRVAVVGGIEEMSRLALSAYALSIGRLEDVTANSLRAFQSWPEYVQFAEETGDKEANTFIKMVNEYGSSLPSLLTSLRAGLVREDEANLIISTAHKAKGREWELVWLADDFPGLINSAGEIDIEQEELNILYVASTRARRRLRANSSLLEAYHLREKAAADKRACSTHAA